MQRSGNGLCAKSRAGSFGSGFCAAAADGGRGNVSCAHLNLSWNTVFLAEGPRRGNDFCADMLNSGVILAEGTSLLGQISVAFAEAEFCGHGFCAFRWNRISAAAAMEVW
ncbi:hypothetical protein [Paraburkholderia eburnea]|uniref:hypothetical protein n=1 Tax=Paraburkholderia eburnea TaxID=1189126 RepID=UPI0011B0DFB3|nr:hypothetical protein [Paraburkholderia eburnea]